MTTYHVEVDAKPVPEDGQFLEEYRLVSHYRHVSTGITIST